jgi:hypothetical protein
VAVVSSYLAHQPATTTHNNNNGQQPGLGLSSKLDADGCGSWILGNELVTRAVGGWMLASMVGLVCREIDVKLAFGW